MGGWSDTCHWMECAISRELSSSSYSGLHLGFMALHPPLAPGHKSNFTVTAFVKAGGRQLGKERAVAINSLLLQGHPQSLANSGGPARKFFNGGMGNRQPGN